MSKDDSDGFRLTKEKNTSLASIKNGSESPLYTSSTPTERHPGQITVSGKAATNYANITRAQYDDWLERFYPKQKELMESTQTGALLKEQLARVDENFDSANQAAQVANNNQLARYGIAASQDLSAQAKGALANVTSKNSLREYEKDRSMSVLSGSGKSNLSQLEV